MSESPHGSGDDIALPLDLSAVAALVAEYGPLRLRIGGLPDTVRLSAGDRQADGTWLIRSADWAGLTLLAPPDAPDFDLEMMPEPDEAPVAAPPTPDPEPPAPEALAPEPLTPEPPPEPPVEPAPPAGAAADRPTAVVPTQPPPAPAPPEPKPAAPDIAMWAALGAGSAAGALGLPVARRESWIDAVDDDAQD